jgi:hypothetical protein
MHARRHGTALTLALSLLAASPLVASRQPVQAGASAAALFATAATPIDSRFGVVEAWRQPQQAATIRVGWERLTLWWKAFQPTGPTSWNAFATGRDHYINHEVAAGRELVGELIATPDWAAVQPKQHANAVPQGLYLPYNDPRNYWGHFVSLMAKHYAGRIDSWIIWNEVNIPSGQFATWKGSVADYAQLVKVASLAAKHANPKAKIILAGDPYFYDHGAFFQTLLGDLTQGADAAAHGAYFDAANLHLYNRALDYTTIIPAYRAMLAQHGLAKPIWIGETNAIPYNDPVRPYQRANYFASLDDQASYIVEAFAIALANGVSKIEVNRMIDGTDFVAGGEPFGLLRNDRSPRPAYFAYRTVTSLFNGVSSASYSADAATGIDSVTLHKPGAIITVAWDQKPTAAAITIAALGGATGVYSKLGAFSPASAQGGQFHFTLAPATGNTDQHDRGDYVIGGSPLILVQTMQEPAAPSPDNTRRRPHPEDAGASRMQRDKCRYHDINGLRRRYG